MSRPNPIMSSGRPHAWVLDGHRAVPAENMDAAARQFDPEAADLRRVGWDELDAGVTVSTVFIVYDHQFGDGPPLLFETMVFNGDHDGWQDRYPTWEEAEAGHAAVVAALKAGLGLPGDVD